MRAKTAEGATYGSSQTDWREPDFPSETQTAAHLNQA